MGLAWGLEWCPVLLQRSGQAPGFPPDPGLWHVPCPQVSGFDKELVGQFSANIRSKREPEPYKGKGVR